MPTYNDGMFLTLGVTPLFVESKAVLLSRLRLSGTDATDALSIIDFAIQRVRKGLYGYISRYRIDSILSVPSAINPTSDEDLLRAMAEEVEVLWVRFILLQELPTLFMDSSADTHVIWNQENLTRSSGRISKKELDSLWEQILTLLAQIEAGSASPTGDAVSLIGPDCPQPRPGATVGLPYTYPTDRHRL